MYYYAVATSTIGESTNRITSDTKEVIVASEEQKAERKTKPEEAKKERNKTGRKENRGKISRAAQRK